MDETIIYDRIVTLLRAIDRFEFKASDTVFSSTRIEMNKEIAIREKKIDEIISEARNLGYQVSINKHQKVISITEVNQKQLKQANYLTLKQ